MSQQQFEQFMQDQAAAMAAQVELTAEEWIEQHAEEFRDQWERSHA